jgi:hypothetical protein
MQAVALALVYFPAGQAGLEPVPIWPAVQEDSGVDAAGAGVATFQHEVEFIHGLPSRRCDIDECSLELSLSRPANASSSPTAAR